MRKSIFMMLLLTVLGIASSCEKPEVPPVSTEVDQGSAATLNSGDDECSILGCWKAIVEDVNLGMEKGTLEYVFRFYDDGKGHISANGYNDKGRSLYSSFSGFAYKVEADVLSLCYDYSTEWAETKISVNSNTMVIYNCDGNGLDLFLTKHEDADSRFIGDWSTMRSDGEFYYDDHIQFITPTNCVVYSYKYKNLSTPPVDSSEVGWFVYEFNETEIVIETLSAQSYMKKYYRFEGDKLYLSDAKDGEEVCYKKN